MAANGVKTELDGTMVLTITLLNATSNQLVNVTPKATRLILLQKVRQQLRTGNKETPQMPRHRP